MFEPATARTKRNILDVLCKWRQSLQMLGSADPVVVLAFDQAALDMMVSDHLKISWSSNGG